MLCCSCSLLAGFGFWQSVCSLAELTSLYVVGGWDSKIKYWDLRTNSSVGEVQLEAKVYAMDIRDQLLVVGTAEQQGAPAANSLSTAARPATDRTRKMYCFNLKNPTQPLKVENSPLQYQTRCVAAFPGNAGYLVGSIEGRVGVQNFDGMHPDKQPSYTFKCHRRTLDAQGNVAQNTKQVCNCRAISTLYQREPCCLACIFAVFSRFRVPPSWAFVLLRVAEFEVCSAKLRRRVPCRTSTCGKTCMTRCTLST